MEVYADDLLITGGIITLVAVAFCAVLALGVAAAAMILWVVGSVLMLLPKFYFAYRDGHASSSWPAMLFYLVAPTSAVLLGVGTAERFQVARYTPAVVTEVQSLFVSGWGMALLVFVGAVLLAMNLASVGVYAASFSWSHQAYQRRGFSYSSLLMLGMLFLVAFLALPTLAWVRG